MPFSLAASHLRVPIPFGNKPGDEKKPKFQTGSRALIKIGGVPIGVATDFRWHISYAAIPTQTIDSVHPWDIDIGAISINANLNKIMDPTSSLEAKAIFHVMQSAIHQPLVELQVLDKIGSSLFFSRGSFNSMAGNVSRGVVSSFSADFVGIAYQHNVSQSFKPYSSIAGTGSAFVDGLSNLASDFSQGIL